MKHCDACNVDFTGDMARCPLCQNELRGEAPPPPHSPRSRSICVRGVWRWKSSRL